ncbi:DHC6 protein, partial [Haematococcus lacustris]
SIGASIDNDGRRLFNDFLRKLLDGEVDKSPERTDFDLGPGVPIQEGFKLAVAIPKEGSVYDYVFDKSRCQWKPWMETVTVRG